MVLIPQANYHYIGDHEFHPYGNKSDQLILERCEYISKLLIERGCQCIVVACNTATANAIDYLRDKFEVEFIGVEPYLNILSKQDFHREDQIGALVTKRTMESDRFIALKKRADPEGRLEVVHLVDLASFIEKNLHRSHDDLFYKELEIILAPVKGRGWSHLILGCTHYPLISDAIAHILNVKCLIPTMALAQRIQVICADYLKNSDTEEVFKSEKLFYYLSTNNNDEWSQQSLKDFMPWRYSNI